jgi:hypothetical protein
MRAIRIAAGFALLLLLGGCLVESEATLGDPDPAAADPRLLGSWYHAERNGASLVSIADDPAQPGAYRVVYASIRPRGEKPVEFVTYSVWPTVVNGARYLNIRRTGGSVLEHPVLTIMAYDIGADDALVLRLISTKAVIEAIKAGRLEGTIAEGRFASEARITSPRADLVAFIAGAERNVLFSDKAEAMRRMTEARH